MPSIIVNLPYHLHVLLLTCRPHGSNWTGIAWNNSMVEDLKAYYNYTKGVIYPVCSGLSSKSYVSIFWFIYIYIYIKHDN